MKPLFLRELDLRNDWRAFATELFKLEDADPGYVLLKRADLPYDQKLRYIAAWCTYYNPGIAAIASQYMGREFYAYLRSVYPTAKRASERRHFRGKAGLKALQDWEDQYHRVEHMVEACYAPTYLGVRKNMKDMTQMGDYFYWKLADIWDTVFDKRVDFTGCEKYMPKVPKQGAQIIHDLEWPWVAVGDGNTLNEKTGLLSIMRVMTAYMKTVYYMDVKKPALALQEAETVCCVFKQHVVGDYFFGSRSAKAWKRLQAVKDEAPYVVKKLQDGLLAGGIWTEKSLNILGDAL